LAEHRIRNSKLAYAMQPVKMPFNTGFFGLFFTFDPSVETVYKRVENGVFGCH
jgi:hypothetical protein